MNPLFPITMWNQHHEAPIGNPRIKNVIEAWHRFYNVTIGCHHPNLWKFIGALKREQGLAEAKQAKYIGGDKPVKRLKNRANEEGYLSRPPLEFLRGVAHRFSIN